MAGIYTQPRGGQFDPTGKPIYRAPVGGGTPAPAPAPMAPSGGGNTSGSYPGSVGGINNVANAGPRPGEVGSAEYARWQAEQENLRRQDQFAAEERQRQQAIDDWNRSQDSTQTGRGGRQLNPNTYGPTGKGQISQDTFEDHETIRLKNQLARENADRNQQLLEKYLGGGGNQEGAVGYDPSAQKAAREAAFARAKDQQGQIARSSLDSMRGILSETGRLGGGYEDAALTSVVNEAQGGLGEVTREQMIQDLADINRNEDRALTRRGQDMNYRQSLLGLINATLY